MPEGRTVMEVWMAFAGWQGGTIHQAMREFNTFEEDRRQQFLTMLREEPNLADTQGFAEDFKDIHERR